MIKPTLEEFAENTTDESIADFIRNIISDEEMVKSFSETHLDLIVGKMYEDHIKQIEEE